MGLYTEPFYIDTTGSKRLKEGSKLYDKEIVLLIIHGLYSQIFLKLRDRGFQILIIALGKNNSPKVARGYIEPYEIETSGPNTYRKST